MGTVARGPAAPLPLTIITGFLGAGKTTLLNALLRDPALKDTAVLVNEVGEIGLDHLFYEKVGGDTMLLAGGCMCCSVRGDLVTALENILRGIDNGKTIEFRRVVIETTGLADPASVLHTVMAHPYLVQRYRLDGLVTAVDAVNGEGTLDRHIEAVKQAAMADRLVLTKTDLAAPEAAAALEARLRALNPVAPLLRAVGGEIAPAALLGAGGFATEGRIPEVAAWLAAEARHDHHHHDHHHHHDPNRHDAGIHAFGLVFDAPLAWDGIATWLEMLALTRGESVLRVKGLLNVAGEERPIVVHGVQHVFHPPVRLAAWPEGHDRRSRITFVLRNLPREVVEEGLAAFLSAAQEKATTGAA